MTADKDFKRIVRERARQTGESYSAVQQRLRKRGSKPSKEKHMITVARTVPDIRSLDLRTSQQFYEGLFGFKTVMDASGMLILASPSQPKQQLTLNGDNAEAKALPPGFAIDVGLPSAVAELHERAAELGCPIIEPMEDKPMGIRRFSLLDPSGTRVTVLAHLDGAHQPSQ
jgi:predicted enzyme related to lactoylglutathione lyase